MSEERITNEAESSETQKQLEPKGVPRTVTIAPVVSRPVAPTTHAKKRHKKNSLSGVIPVIQAAELNEDYPDRIRLGICAMDKKARSKPMAEILSRLDPTLFHVVFFGDDMILNRPIEEW